MHNIYKSKPNSAEDNLGTANITVVDAHSTRQNPREARPKGSCPFSGLCGHTAAKNNPCQCVPAAADLLKDVAQPLSAPKYTTSGDGGSKSISMLRVEDNVPLRLSKSPAEISLALSDIAARTRLALSEPLITTVDSPAFQSVHFCKTCHPNLSFSVITRSRSHVYFYHLQVETTLLPHEAAKLTYNVVIQVLAKSCIPLCSAAQHTWFIQSATNPAIFHGTLLVATSHQALAKGSPIPFESYYHRGETIKYINKRLRTPKTRTDDCVIGGIACLVAFEVNPSQLSAENCMSVDS